MAANTASHSKQLPATIVFFAATALLLLMTAAPIVSCSDTATDPQYDEQLPEGNELMIDLTGDSTGGGPRKLLQSRGSPSVCCPGCTKSGVFGEICYITTGACCDCYEARKGIDPHVGICDHCHC